MARDALTGTRIRERRVMLSLKQSELARAIGISASYLNLIEHNRRRIGGKLLLDIADALGVEASMLTEGAEAALIATLREAAERTRMPEAEQHRAEELAGRFPGWADTLAQVHRKSVELERTVEALTDRLAHDPALAASVHEVLTTAAAIRSTAAILVEDKELAPQWRDRFHANIDTDSRRLAQSSKALVAFLDAETGEGASPTSPQEEVEAFLRARAYDFSDLETGATTATELVSAGAELTTQSARGIARTVLERMRADSAAVRAAVVRDALAARPCDPVALAADFEVSVACMMRRIAALPEQGCGLIIADRAGSLLFRKAVPGFTVPRYGAACPLWPIFEVMAQPGHVVHQRVRMAGQGGAAVFDCFATAEPIGPRVINAQPLVEATMLIVPVPAPEEATSPVPVADVGGACRICPLEDCRGRREPSVLSVGL